MKTEIEDILNSCPAKYLDKFHQLILKYVVNQNKWISSDKADMDAFKELQRALDLLRHDPFNIKTDVIEKIADNCQEWEIDLREMERHNGRAYQTSA
jgi:predicted metal-dependent enzyme (double-stranded beta helix superfamily)